MFLKRLSFHAQYFLCIIHDITLKQQKQQRKRKIVRKNDKLQALNFMLFINTA